MTNAAKPRTNPAEVRRAELLDAAQILFLALGIAATSVLYYPPDDWRGRLRAWVVGALGGP